MSIHQLNNDSTEPICAFCGSEGHMPTLSDSKKKWEFGDLCAFGGHTLNVKKLTTIECSLPMANYPLKCPFCPDEQLIWRYDMGKHMETKHPDARLDHIVQTVYFPDGGHNFKQVEAPLLQSLAQAGPLNVILQRRRASE